MRVSPWDSQQKLIKILVVDIAHSFQWNEIYSAPTNQSTVPFVTPWRRIFILEKKACKSKKPKKFACQIGSSQPKQCEDLKRQNLSESNHHL